MRKPFLQPENQMGWVAFWACLLFFSCHENWLHAEKSRIPLQELQFYEKILIEFQKEGKARENAIQELESYCRWRDTKTGLSCANLAILYKSIGDLPRAYTASVMAYKIQPHNPYYQNLMRQLAMATGNLPDLEKRMGKDGRVFSLYSYALYYCQNQSYARALEYLIPLIQENLISREQLERGVFYECFRENPFLLEEWKSQLPYNSTRYSEKRIEEEQSAHPFHSIWDFSYAKKIREESEDIEKLTTNKEFTKLWFQFRRSVSSQKIQDAEMNYKEIQTFLNQYKRKGEREKLLAESLELAIELLITQDPSFRTVRHLR